MTTYGTSAWQARIRNDPTVFAADPQPVGAEVAASIVSNNLDHYCDSYGQVRLNFSGDALTPKKSGVVVDTWYQITASEAFPVPLRADGSAYKLRVRIGGRSTAGHAVRFAFVLAPVLEAPRVLNTNATDSVFTTGSVTSTSVAWLTGASVATSHATLMQLTADEIARYTVRTSTPIDLGGARVELSQCLVNVVVYGRTANTGSEPELRAAFAAEWVG
jgi:hypothetical protein